MNRGITTLAACLVLVSFCPPALCQISKVRVGYCARTISVAAAPYAVATEMGWFKQEGIEVSLVPLSGNADCVKNIANKEILFASADVSPLAVARIQGLKAKTFRARG